MVYNNLSVNEPPEDYDDEGIPLQQSSSNFYGSDRRSMIDEEDNWHEASRNSEESINASQVATPNQGTERSSRLPTLLSSFIAMFQGIKWWWWWEVGAAMLSIICMVLIAAILATMHDQPLSKWKLAIQINTAVSILATVAKSALMLLVAEIISHLKWIHYEKEAPLTDLQTFDEASRGPYGAVTFILKMKGRAWSTFMACVVSLLAVGFDPAAQQILSFPIGSFVNQNTTSTARTYYATAYIPIVDDAQFNQGVPHTLVTKLVSAFAGAVPDAQYGCPTSDCNFGDLTTLAVCETCRDISRTVTSRPRNASESSYHNIIYEAKDAFYPTILDYGASSSMIVSSGCMSHNETVERVPKGPFFGFMTVHHKDAKIWGQKIIEHENLIVPGAYDPKMSIVTTCDFAFCVRTYHGLQVQNNALTAAKEIRLPLSAFESRPQTNRTLGRSYAEYTVRDNPDSNVSYLAFGHSPRTVHEAGPQTQVSKLILDLFFVEWLGRWLKTNIEGEAMNNTNIALMVDRDANVTARYIADAITNWMRMQSVNEGTIIQGGNSYETISFVRVKWVWLLWPLSLTLISSLLLVWAILSGMSRPTLLKSSALGLLFHGLSGFEKDELKTQIAHRHESGDDLKQLAKAFKVAFERSKDGHLAFVKQ